MSDIGHLTRHDAVVANPPWGYRWRSWRRSKRGRSTHNRVQVDDLPAAATGGGDHAPTLRSWPGGSTATARVAFSIRGRFLAKGGKPCDRRGDGGHDDRPREPSKVNSWPRQMAVNTAFMLYVAEVLTVKSKRQGAGAG